MVGSNLDGSLQRNPIPDNDNFEPYEERALVRIAIILSLIALVVFKHAQVFVGKWDFNLLTADDQLRVTRVLDLIEGRNGWFDNSLHWSNTPFGTTIHWTRPLDIVIILLSFPFALVLGWHDAVMVGSFLSAPALFLTLLSVFKWAVRPLLGNGPSGLAMLIIAVQPVILDYGALGRVDHHIALLTVFIALFGAAVRTPVPTNINLSILAGLVAALGLWVSPEAHLGIGLLVATWGLSWIAYGTHARQLFAFSTSYLGGLLVAAFLELGPSRLFATEYDRISRPHMVLGMSLVMGSGVILLAFRHGKQSTRKGRFMIASLSGLVAFATATTCGLDVVTLAGAPYSTIPNDVRTQWLERLGEFQPATSFGSARFACYVAVPIIGFLVATRKVQVGNLFGWKILSGWLLAAIFLGLRTSRLLLYSEALGAVGVAGGAWMLLRQFGNNRGLKTILRPLLAVTTVFGCYLLAAIALAIDPLEQEPSRSACDAKPLIRTLRDRVQEEASGAHRPSGVLTQLDLATTLHLGTGVDVVATGHHPNVEGIRAVRLLFRSTPAAGRPELERRHIRYVVICDGIGTEFMTPMPADSFYEALVKGRPPNWLREIRTGSSGSWLYEVLLSSKT